MFTESRGSRPERTALSEKEVARRERDLNNLVPMLAYGLKNRLDRLGGGFGTVRVHAVAGDDWGVAKSPDNTSDVPNIIVYPRSSLSNDLQSVNAQFRHEIGHLNNPMEASLNALRDWCKQQNIPPILLTSLVESVHEASVNHLEIRESISENPEKDFQVLYEQEIKTSEIADTIHNSAPYKQAIELTLLYTLSKTRVIPKEQYEKALANVHPAVQGVFDRGVRSALDQAVRMSVSKKKVEIIKDFVWPKFSKLVNISPEGDTPSDDAVSDERESNDPQQGSQQSQSNNEQGGQQSQSNNEQGGQQSGESSSSEAMQEALQQTQEKLNDTQQGTQQSLEDMQKALQQMQEKIDDAQQGGQQSQSNNEQGGQQSGESSSSEAMQEALQQTQEKLNDTQQGTQQSLEDMQKALQQMQEKLDDAQQGGQQSQPNNEQGGQQSGESSSSEAMQEALQQTQEKLNDTQQGTQQSLEDMQKALQQMQEKLDDAQQGGQQSQPNNEQGGQQSQPNNEQGGQQSQSNNEQGGQQSGESSSSEAMQEALQQTQEKLNDAQQGIQQSLEDMQKALQQMQENLDDAQQGGQQSQPNNEQGGQQSQSNNEQGGQQSQSNNEQGGQQSQSNNEQGGQQSGESSSSEDMQKAMQQTQENFDDAQQQGEGMSGDASSPKEQSHDHFEKGGESNNTDIERLFNKDLLKQLHDIESTLGSKFSSYEDGKSVEKHISGSFEKDIDAQSEISEKERLSKSEDFEDIKHQQQKKLEAMYKEMSGLDGRTLRIYIDYMEETKDLINELTDFFVEKFDMDKGRTYERNQTRGTRLQSGFMRKVLGAKQHGQGSPVIDPHVFERKKMPKIPQFAWTLIIDNSGSCGGEIIEQEKKVAVALIEVAKKLSIPLEIMTFGGVNNYVFLKEFEQDMIGEDLQNVVLLNADQGTPDVVTLNAACASMDRFSDTLKKSHNFVYFMTDGQSGEGRIESVIEQYRKDMVIMGIGLGDAANTITSTWGKNALPVHNIKNLPHALIDGIEKQIDEIFD